MISKAYAKTGSACKVTFKLAGDEAKGVKEARLAGDFNGWDITSAGSKMTLKDGTFSKTLSLEKGKEYQFRYFLNGQRWENDWYADRYQASPLGIADDNSVVIV